MLSGDQGYSVGGHDCQQIWMFIIQGTDGLILSNANSRSAAVVPMMRITLGISVP